MRRVLSSLIAIAGLAALSASPASASRSGGLWDFVSAPDLHPPKLQVLLRRPGLAQGYFLGTAQQYPIGPSQSHGQAGPLIMDSDARPVWFLPLSDAFNLQQETYRGRPVLVVYTALESSNGPEHGPPSRPGEGFPNAGRVVIYDENYRRIATIRIHSPWAIDLHDAWIAGRDIRITVVRNVNHQNLTRYGGPRDGAVADVGLQELQVSTGRMIRTWDALNPRGKPNVPLSASHQGVGASADWDAYHLNSVEALPDGNLLVSMRNTWSVYLISPVKNRVLWTLGGKDSSFHVPRDARFAWQHDARLVNPSGDGRGRAVKLTLFDNNTDRGAAKGMVLTLNTSTRRAKLVAAYPHHPPYTASELGSMQLLPNSNVLVDWGSPYNYFTELSRASRELLDVAWPLRGPSYRTLFTNTWVGTPYYPPSGAVQDETVYASWNGATEVARWEVLAGASSGVLHVVASQARAGFETAIRLAQSYKVYVVKALDSGGKVLAHGTSSAFG